MTHHSHSHSVEQPAQTEGTLIRWAPYYDFTVNIIALGHAGLLRKMTVDNALIKPGDTVLDVGCGTGEVALLAKNADQRRESLRHRPRTGNDRRSPKQSRAQKARD